MVELLKAARPDLRFPCRGAADEIDVHIAYCPERVLPGRVLVELVENSRVVGGLTPACSERAKELYRIFCKGELHVTDARTAEMCKLTENAFRDVNIAFANELSRVCDSLGIDVWELVRLANHHPRVNILQPGPGVGGHCIAVDPWFIVEAAPEETPLIRTARQVNDGKPKRVIDKIRAAADAALKANRRPVVGLFGLAFKADVDDLRESPALAIAEAVASWEDCEILVSEPNVRTLPPSLEGKPGVRFVENVDELVASSDILVMLVNHKQYLKMAPEAMSQKVLIDTRGVWPRERSA
jgi:UDP-N-acetyl-D-mannosaminuronic acid dehydrogenase